MGLPLISPPSTLPHYSFIKLGTKGRIQDKPRCGIPRLAWVVGTLFVIILLFGGWGFFIGVLQIPLPVISPT